MNALTRLSIPCTYCGNKCMDAGPLELDEIDEHPGESVEITRTFGCRNCGAVYTVTYNYEFKGVFHDKAIPPNDYMRRIIESSYVPRGSRRRRP